MSDSEEKKAIPCKVVLIGESGVGKTSIISRYMTDKFSASLGSTPGANFTTKTVFLKDENQSIKFEIWDTAGQEKYRALSKIFYKNSNVCILVYDITNKKSFDEIRNYWIHQVKEYAPKDASKKNIYI
jgi:small GTP-binding protein